MRRTVRSIENPETLKAAAMLHEAKPPRVEILEARVKELAEGALLPNRAEALDRESLSDYFEGLDGDKDAKSEDGTEEGNFAQQDSKKLQDESIRASHTLRYFADISDDVGRYRTALEKVDAETELVTEQLSAVVHEEKRKYACATELERRIWFG